MKVPELQKPTRALCAGETVAPTERLWSWHDAHKGSLNEFDLRTKLTNAASVCSLKYHSLKISVKKFLMHKLCLTRIKWISSCHMWDDFSGWADLVIGWLEENPQGHRCSLSAPLCSCLHPATHGRPGLRTDGGLFLTSEQSLDLMHIEKWCSCRFEVFSPRLFHHDPFITSLSFPVKKQGTSLRELLQRRVTVRSVSRSQSFACQRGRENRQLRSRRGWSIQGWLQTAFHLPTYTWVWVCALMHPSLGCRQGVSPAWLLVQWKLSKVILPGGKKFGSNKLWRWHKLNVVDPRDAPSVDKYREIPCKKYQC